MRCHDVNSGSFNDLILVEVWELDGIFLFFVGSVYMRFESCRCAFGIRI